MSGLGYITELAASESPAHKERVIALSIGEYMVMHNDDNVVAAGRTHA